MTLYRCTKQFFYRENDGNSDIEVCVPRGALFLVNYEHELPGGYYGDAAKEYFEVVESLVIKGDEGR